jgi:hypothetical protein
LLLMAMSLNRGVRPVPANVNLSRRARPLVILTTWPPATRYLGTRTPGQNPHGRDDPTMRAEVQWSFIDRENKQR